MSDDVRCKVDSSRYCIVRNVRFGVRSCPKCPIWCPVMSGAVRCCPILSHLSTVCHAVYMVHWSTSTTKTPCLQGPRGVWQNCCRMWVQFHNKVQMTTKHIYEYMDSAQNQYHLLMTSSADSDLTSKFKGTLLMKMVGDFSA